MGDGDKVIEDLKELQAEEEQAGTEQVPVEDPEEQEEGAEAGPSPRQAARRERANKFKAEQEGRAAAERERDDLRVRLAAAEAAQRYAAPPPKEEPKPDPADKAIADVSKEMQELQDQYGQLTTMAAKANQAVDPEVVKSFRAKWDSLGLKRSELVAEKAHRKVSATSTNGGPSAQEAAAIAAMQMRYADIEAHPEAKRIGQWASGQWQSHLASGGSYSMDQMDRIMNEARLKFGLAKKPPPGPGTKARYAGVGAGASAAGGEQNGSAAKNFPMTKVQKAMAMEAFPDLPEKQAIQKFIQIQLKRGVKTA